MKPFPPVMEEENLHFPGTQLRASIGYVRRGVVKGRGGEWKWQAQVAFDWEKWQKVEIGKWQREVASD